MKYSLVLLTLLSVALTPIVHESIANHDSAECTVCIYQPNTDFKTSDAHLVIAEFFVESERVEVSLPAAAKVLKVNPFHGRAPPQFA